LFTSRYPFPASGLPGLVLFVKSISSEISVHQFRARVLATTKLVERTVRSVDRHLARRTARTLPCDLYEAILALVSWKSFATTRWGAARLKLPDQDHACRGLLFPVTRRQTTAFIPSKQPSSAVRTHRTR